MKAYDDWAKIKSLEEVLAWIKANSAVELAGMQAITLLAAIYQEYGRINAQGILMEVGKMTLHEAPGFAYALMVKHTQGRSGIRMIPNEEGKVVRVEVIDETKATVNEHFLQ